MIDATALLNSTATTAPASPLSQGTSRSADQPVVAETTPKRELTVKEMHSVVGELNKTMEALGTKVVFALDTDTQKPVIRVIDSSSNQLIFQMPPEGMLRAAQRMTQLLGMIVDQTN